MAYSVGMNTRRVVSITGQVVCLAVLIDMAGMVFLGQSILAPLWVRLFF